MLGRAAPRPARTRTSSPPARTTCAPPTPATVADRRRGAAGRSVGEPAARAAAAGRRRLRRGAVHHQHARPPTPTPYWADGVPAPGTAGRRRRDPRARRQPGRRAGARSWSRSTCASSRRRPASRAGAPSGAGELRGWLALLDERGVRPGLAAVRRRRLPAGDLRHRADRLGADARAHRLRARPAGAGTGAGAADGAADRRPAGRRGLLGLGLPRPARRAGHPAGRRSGSAERRTLERSRPPARGAAAVAPGSPGTLERC